MNFIGRTINRVNEQPLSYIILEIITYEPGQNTQIGFANFKRSAISRSASANPWITDLSKNIAIPSTVLILPNKSHITTILKFIETWHHDAYKN